MKNKRFLWALMLCAFYVSWVNAASRISLNENWSFSKSDSLGNYTQWERVDIPHTWNVKDANDEIPGYFRGKCRYSKNIFVPLSKSGERVQIYFEGANQETTLYVNNKYVGHHVGGYTGFGFDLTAFVQFGAENRVEVEVSNVYDATIAPLSADFTFFGGIYRDVWLSYKSPIHFTTDYYGSSGIVVNTPNKNGIFNSVDVQCRVKNFLSKKSKVMLRTTLLDANGKMVSKVDKCVNLPIDDADYLCKVRVPVRNPHLWSDIDPYLYRIMTELIDIKHGTVLDEQSCSLGFRWFRFDAQKGFFLNGKHVKLIGTSRHQDFQDKGNALSDNIHVSDVLKLKEMGGNFLRVAHYPQDPTILEMCDRLGILTSVEIPVINAVDSCRQFLENCKHMEMEMICQNRNHPSVVMWGWMNEILLRIPSQWQLQLPTYYALARGVATELNLLARQEDPERCTMMAIHNAFDRYAEAGLVDIPQVLGLNLYQGWYEKDIKEFEATLDNIHQKMPSKPLFVTEYGAGIDPRLHSSSPERFDFSQEYGLLYHQHYLAEMLTRDYVAGSSIWNLCDFYSESRGDAVPHVNSKGVLGLDRCEKDVYLYYKAMLSNKPTVLVGGKDWKYRTLVGKGTADTASLEVPIFTNASSVSVSCNEILLGEFTVKDGVAWVKVPVADGDNTIKASTMKDGHEVSDVLAIQVNVVPEDVSKNFPKTGLHVMCGSNRYFEDKAESLCWLPEQSYKKGSWGYVGGNVYRRTGQLLGTDADILGTDNDPIYQTQRQNIEAFIADVPDGEYVISLHLAQLKDAASLVYNLSSDTSASSDSDCSVFDLQVNGQTLLDEMDMAQYGYSRAVVKRVQVMVKEGQGLNIRFVPRKGKTILSAIEIYRK